MTETIRTDNSETLKNALLKIRLLEEQIEKMKCCSNCNGINAIGLRTEKCKFCMRSKALSEWELKND